MKISYFNYMNGLWGYSIGSTVKAIKLLSGLEKYGVQVVFNWLRDGVKEPEPSATKAPEKRNWVKALARILLFTPKEMLHNFIDYRKELSLAKQQQSDLIIARLDIFRISSWFVAKKLNVPFVVEADGANSYEWLYYNGGPHLWKWVVLACERFLLQRAAFIFTQTDVAKDYFLQTHKLPAEKFYVISNGADIVTPISESKRDSLKHLLHIQKDQIVVGFLGSMHHWHGIGDLKELVRNTFAHHPKAVFLFVGSGGSQADSLKSQFSAQEQQRLIFSGNIDNKIVNEYVQLFDIALAPYPNIELFYFSPVKIYEYMAAGKAIVAPSIGQIAQVLQHEISAALYTPGNFPDLQDKLLALLDSEQQRLVLGKQAQLDFLHHHTWQQKSQQLFELLSRY